MQHSVRYTVMFAAILCVVCSIFVASAAVLLKDKQEANAVLDRQIKVLDVAGLLADGAKPSPAEVDATFKERIKPVVVELKTGQAASGVDPLTFDQLAARNDPARSIEAPKNPAQVQRIPNHGLVYELTQGDVVKGIILPLEGKGLWSTLYGFLALESDARTVRGITFYQHAETPGLGGEVDNPRWKSLWPGRKAFDKNWKPVLAVKKGQAGTPEADPYHVDGLSGATITSRGVTDLLQFWLGENGFGPFLEAYRAEKGIK